MIFIRGVVRFLLVIFSVFFSAFGERFFIGGAVNYTKSDYQFANSQQTRLGSDFKFDTRALSIAGRPTVPTDAITANKENIRKELTNQYFQTSTEQITKLLSNANTTIDASVITNAFAANYITTLNKFEGVALYNNTQQPSVSSQTFGAYVGKKVESILYSKGIITPNLQTGTITISIDVKRINALFLCKNNNCFSTSNFGIDFFDPNNIISLRPEIADDLYNHVLDGFTSITTIDEKFKPQNAYSKEISDFSTIKSSGSSSNIGGSLMVGYVFKTPHYLLMHLEAGASTAFGGNVPENELVIKPSLNADLMMRFGYIFDDAFSIYINGGIGYALNKIVYDTEYISISQNYNTANVIFGGGFEVDLSNNQDLGMFLEYNHYLPLFTKDLSVTSNISGYSGLQIKDFKVNHGMLKLGFRIYYNI